MYFYFLSNIILDDNISLRQKISKLKENYIFYRRLQQLLKKGTIYHSLEDKKITNDFLGHLTKEDHNLIKKIFEKNVKEFLKLGNLKNSLTFEADDDFRQIGYGTMLLQKPVRSGSKIDQKNPKTEFLYRSLRSVTANAQISDLF